MNILKSKLSLSIKIPKTTTLATAVKETNLSNKSQEQKHSNQHEIEIENEKKAIQKKSECNLIYENIYLSGYNCGSDLDFLTKNSFTHIINCAKASRNFTAKNFENFSYLNLNLEDDPGFPISEAIKTFIDFVEKANEALPSRKILVHCFEGISRGPSLLAAYLIWKLQISKEAALKFIKEKRPCVEINFGFLFQLEKWSRFCEDKNKLLNKKMNFSIQKSISSSIIKHEYDINYFSNGNYNKNSGSANNSSDDSVNLKLNTNDIDCFFFHSKIRVVEQVNNQKEKVIGVIRILNCNKENQDEDYDYNSERKNKQQEVEVNVQKEPCLILNED